MKIAPNLSKSWQIYAAAIAVCGGLTAASYFFGIEPALAQREMTAANETELEHRRQTLSELSGKLENTKQELEHTREAVVNLPLRLESAANINVRLERLATLAADTDVAITLDEVQPEPARDGLHYQIVPIRMGGTGKYPGCATFFHRLREKFPDMAVKSFELVTQRPTPEGAIGTIHIELEWYTSPVRK